ncbi:MAG TPA: signal peptide peptidase SppA [Rhizomicrobium sp.]|nr:signal peptide peptidase SppA [Rhizomicrobium sp.]
MLALLGWLRSIFASVLNGIAKTVAFLVVVTAILVVISLARGDGLPSNSVLTLDLRQSIPDSANRPAFPLTARPVTLMDIIFALDSAGRDGRIKGLVMRLGDGGVALSQAEELSQAIARFKARGKFVIAQATSFQGPGMGDYLAATAASEIWVQPKSDFGVSGAGVGEFFLRGLIDKVHATPQMVKRAEYKSAADTFMEKTMTSYDREQLTALTQSWYDGALNEIAAARHIGKDQVQAAFEASPQFAEDAKARGLVDRIGYDDDALSAALARAGSGAKPLKMSDYIKSRDDTPTLNANVAVIEAAGEIADGTARNNPFQTSSGIASDDLSDAIRQATRDSNIKAIVLRVDSPGGSVTASDQILDAVKKAQSKGKPVVVSMGSLAASGGYYISTSADRIVAEPGTLTGSIGVLTGKVSFGGTSDLIGARLDEVAIGKNTLIDSPVTAFTPDQLNAINHEADVIYQDFLTKVANGRHLPLERVGEIARGRVWTGSDAATRGLVNRLGGFWTAAAEAGSLGKLPPDQLSFRVYPKPRGFLEEAEALMGAGGDAVKALESLKTVMDLPPVRGVTEAVHEMPRERVELRAPGLPQLLGR